MKRIKRRYLAVQIDSDGVITAKEFMEAVWGAVTRLYGEYGASLTSLKLLNYDDERKVAVIRAALVTVVMVRAALASILSIAGREAAVHVVTVSGTLKSLREKL